MVNKHISTIENDIQDRSSLSWKRLCDYVDQLADSDADEFTPREFLGNELFSEIFTLPESISKLKKIKKVSLYGSKLKRIPPEIGEMTSLEYFDVYTSYGLNWFPYELTSCIKLIDSRISTRALYGNYKNRMGFPRLDRNPVRYFGELLKCGVCKKQIAYEETSQLWITLKIGTDVVPLLVNVCSEHCEEKLPHPPENYVQYAHKGGSSLQQPPNYDELLRLELLMRRSGQTEKAPTSIPAVDLQKNEIVGVEKLIPLKLIKKIWDR